MLLTCPHCHRKNRLPPARLDQQPHCGACKQLLFTGTPLELDDQRFASHASSDLPLVIDFWAPWCGPCRQFAPVFQQAAPLVEPRARLVKVNTEQAQGLAARFAIRSIPTLLIVQGGREMARVSGALPGGELLRWLQQHLPPLPAE